MTIPAVVFELLKNAALWAGPQIGAKATELYTEGAIAKINERLGQVWARLRGQNPNAARALQALEEQQDTSVLSRLETYLEDELEQDEGLRELVGALAQELENGKLSETAGIHVDISGEHARGTVNHNPHNQGTIYQADSMTFQQGPS